MWQIVIEIHLLTELKSETSIELWVLVFSVPLYKRMVVLVIGPQHNSSVIIGQIFMKFAVDIHGPYTDALSEPLNFTLELPSGHFSVTVTPQIALHHSNYVITVTFTEFMRTRT